MTKRTDELRAKLSGLLQQQSAPDAVLDDDATTARQALMKALANASLPKAGSKVFRLRRRPRPAGRNLVEDN